MEEELIRKALSTFMENPTPSIARVLAAALRTGRVSYEDVSNLVETGDDTEEVLFSAYSWRLLLPTRTSKSMAWEDRILAPGPGEAYEMPEVIQHLVKQALETGKWDPGKAVAEVFKDMEEGNWDRVPKLVEMLGRGAMGGRISALKIKEVCRELGMLEAVDRLIAELKAGGVISPSLGSFPEATQQRGPIYELNPSLFTRAGTH